MMLVVFLVCVTDYLRFVDDIFRIFFNDCSQWNLLTLCFALVLRTENSMWHFSRSCRPFFKPFFSDQGAVATTCSTREYTWSLKTSDMTGIPLFPSLTFLEQSSCYCSGVQKGTTSLFLPWRVSLHVTAQFRTAALTAAPVLIVSVFCCLIPHQPIHFDMLNSNKKNNKLNFVIPL